MLKPRQIVCLALAVASAGLLLATVPVDRALVIDLTCSSS